MEFEQLITLITAVSDSELTRFSYEENGTVIQMRKEKEEKLVTVNGVPQEVQVVMEQNAAPTAEKEADKVAGNVVTSPLVGTFYASSSPDAEPFIKVGDSVKKGQVLGIVEAMKLMNEIESDYDGTVKKILVSNEDVIEYGQPMFVIG
ncbi:acetyl-CoA carboxylase biotin carboxyl carrier protein [Roseburia sp. MSJ-14]|uniref:acetyl-CoA carboxylase biotin carboxyl carrier protein n=1 Tax=Roseburia sp. MSJ-14 TaxID=2841514 RepID=UPI001C114906|nr:acetyl-CoA carboxylase biotin carboxyl carrier protein [Roseburia sp. MSJ-14]MBU5472949.1 acetyl-CoA carboxylase biotin carboxyl carrier protein [Roseburia sp. MSJ-14]